MTISHPMLAKTAQLRLSPATSIMNGRSLPILLLGAFVALTIFHSQAAPLTANETLKLPSGRIAKILSVSKVEYSKGVMALMVRYQTTLSVDEPAALSQEVDDVWKLVQKEAESNHYVDAV